MRIPFVPKAVNITRNRYNFIKQYKGGGFMLIAGSIYWFAIFLLSFVLDGEILNNIYIWGGLSVLPLGFLIFKILRLRVEPNEYSSLVGFASSFTVLSFPILLLIKNLDSTMILPVLCIINAMHLLILCWIHLEYIYFVMVMLGECISIAFIFSIPIEYIHFVALLWGIISLVGGIIIHVYIDQHLKSYNFNIIDSK